MAAKKSGTQSLSLGKAEHVSQHAISGSFCGSYVMGPLHKLGGKGTVIWGMFPRGCEDTVVHRQLLCNWEGGGTKTGTGTYEHAQTHA